MGRLDEYEYVEQTPFPHLGKIIDQVNKEVRDLYYAFMEKERVNAQVILEQNPRGVFSPSEEARWRKAAKPMV